MNKNSQSRSICQRLINFIVSVTNHAPVAIQEGSSRNKKGPTGPISRPKGDVGSEIVVEFRHTNGSERWIDISNKKDGLISSNRNKTKNIDHFANNENDHKSNRAREDIKPRPLLSVASNINEKSDEYIRSRKKAMSRNYSFE
ncbi:hypothetical protein PHJA_001931100 [Phtheirospermum japonicum]|uniref:Uncharacterized protein n=1 Tax=Phtheirospermum japonicum TaxID=374723 RepID=A0A830CE29_9LAMI|nr:hypothetical protein PHJA_001931100 [Phtheirospermum japonicum]